VRLTPPQPPPVLVIECSQHPDYASPRGIVTHSSTPVFDTLYLHHREALCIGRQPLGSCANDSCGVSPCRWYSPNDDLGTSPRIQIRYDPLNAGVMAYFLRFGPATQPSQPAVVIFTRDSRVAVRLAVLFVRMVRGKD
jgi:hypothetical protein